MTPRAEGFLLLTSHLGDPSRKVLTVAQLRTLAQRVRSQLTPREGELEAADLMALGYGPEMITRILSLLEEQPAMEIYLQKAVKAGCGCLTRGDESYPVLLRHRMGDDAPGVLWTKGDVSLLDTTTVSLVGSRDLTPKNEAFARQVGIQAAKQGFTLVSGNARGADRTAQEACLNAGGRVVSVVADELEKYEPHDRILYVSEDSFDLRFSAQRALSRNRVIHCLGILTFVAQSSLGVGGTWDGTVKNLRNHWSPLFGCRDGSEAMDYLSQMGLQLIEEADLSDFGPLQEAQLKICE